MARDSRAGGVVCSRSAAAAGDKRDRALVTRRLQTAWLHGRPRVCLNRDPVGWFDRWTVHGRPLSKLLVS